MTSTEGPLACPRCARHYPLSERFCADCEMPLVYVGQGEMKPITDAHDKARKVKPQYTRGELVRIAGGRNLAEAELIQGILLEEGIPSMQRRTRGFDVPDFLAAGPRDILVPESAVDDARSLLSEAEVGAGDANGAGRSPLGTDAGPAPVKLLAWILVVLALGSGLLGLVYALSG
jgi:Putative prokaryotic signal transducing protein